MKIGFLAMSGLRAHDPKLLEMGLQLPGVIERGKVVASMPCLGLLWLASVTPQEHEVLYFDAPTADQIPEQAFDCDLVAISVLTAQASQAYLAAKQFRESNVRTAVGGLHSTVCSDECKNHFDHVFVGEAEVTWPAFLNDLKRGEEKTLYKATEYSQPKLEDLPVPRYDLLDQALFNRYPVQTTRGCPWLCDFCASSIMLKRPYRKRPIDHIVRDIRAVKKLTKRPFIELADDNTFVDHRWGKNLCEALIPERIKWFTETDISVADDPELLKLLRQARCRQILVGLESPSEEELSGVELKKDFKRGKASQYRSAIARIQSEGVTVNGCFVLGLDHQGPDIFEKILNFVMEIPLFEVQVTVMTPFPGTPLYDRLLEENRILQPGNWDLCTLFDVNFRPKKMSVEQLKNGLYWLVEKLYSKENIHRRRMAFIESQWKSKMVV